MSRIEFHNSTALSGGKLLRLCREAAAGWAVGTIRLYVRYSRGADFSGTCFYNDGRVFINLGRHLEYPYMMATNLARAVTNGRYWHRPIYRLSLSDGYQVVLFVFLHELYHLLVRRARRNPRQKESRCDRFATGYLVDHFGTPVFADQGKRVPRSAWDFQDTDGFVAAARDRRAARRPITLPQAAVRDTDAGQLLLFPM